MSSPERRFHTRFGKLEQELIDASRAGEPELILKTLLVYLTEKNHKTRDTIRVLRNTIGDLERLLVTEAPTMLLEGKGDTEDAMRILEVQKLSNELSEVLASVDPELEDQTHAVERLMQFKQERDERREQFLQEVKNKFPS